MQCVRISARYGKKGRRMIDSQTYLEINSICLALIFVAFVLMIECCRFLIECESVME